MIETELDYEIWTNEFYPGAQVYAWVKGVEVEAQAKETAVQVASLPIVFKHVAIMPDVHVGVGSNVGTVFACKDAVPPAAVGVDIGCGMTAVQTSMTFDDFKFDLGSMRLAIEDIVPCGFGSGGPVGTWAGKPPNDVRKAWNEICDEYDEICSGEYKDLRHKQPLDQLGTLGSGNHFVEVCVDEENKLWVMLHSGSRGPGNRIGSTFTRIAQKRCLDQHISLPHRDLAYLERGTEEFDAYLKAVGWAQRYALINRNLMLSHVLEALGIHKHEKPIRCHHNYIAHEEHYGEKVMVIRKGAVRAQLGDLCIIPGNMGARSYICYGLGNPLSFNSCSHGAGRRMSRTKARANITLEQHQAATIGVECDKSASTLDESSLAYKDIDAVIRAERTLVKTKHIIKQKVCVKGLS